MTTNFDLPSQFSEEIISSTAKVSAILNTANVVQVPKERDVVQYSFNFTDAAFHNAGASEGNKVVSEDQPEEIEIAMSTLYKILKFKDWEYNDAKGMIAQLEARLPEVLGSTLDKVATAGQALIPTARFVGYTATPVEVDATSASWAAAIDVISDAGHTANAAILDNTFKAVLKKAYVEGTNTNALTVDLQDGFNLGGVSVYFRDLGGNYGVIGDFSKAVIAVNGEVKTNVYHPEDDFQLGLEDKVALKVSMRVGYGVQDQTAFVPVAIASGE